MARAASPAAWAPMLLLAAVLGVLSGCGGEVESRVAVEFVAGGVTLAFTPASAVERVEVLTSPDRRLVVAEGFAGARLLTARVAFDWTPGARHIVRWSSGKGETREVAAAAPDQPPGLLGAELAAPLPAERFPPAGERVAARRVLMPGGGAAHIVCHVFSYADGPLSGTVTFRTAAPESEGADVERPVATATIVRAFALVRRFERAAVEAEVDLPVEGRLVAISRIEPDQSSRFAPLERRVEMVALPPGRIGERLRVVSVRFPADTLGAADPTLAADTVVVAPPPLGGLLRWMVGGAAPPERFAPIGYHAVEIANLGDADVPLLFTARTRTAGGEAVEFLSPPPAFFGADAPVRALRVLPAGGTTVVTLPLFADAARAEPGEYRRRIAATWVGSDAVVLDIHRPLYVETPSATPAITVLVASVAGLPAFAFCLFGFGRLARRAGRRDLILIALFGVTAFLGVSLPAAFLFNVVRAAAGPFSFLATGLVSEVLYYALVASLVRLAPRPGTYALLVVTSQMLGVTLLGLVSLPTLIYAGVSILLGEGALFLAGVTRGPGRAGPWSRGRAAAAALALGAAETGAVFVELALARVFFRLAFAGWYVALYCVTAGFLYTLAGVLLGRRLGERLAAEGEG